MTTLTDLTRLTAALADRYRIERVATDVTAEPALSAAKAHHRFAIRLVEYRWVSIPAGEGGFPLKSLCDVVPSSDVSRGKPR